MSQRRRYRCSPSVVWLKDAQQTLLVNRNEQRSWALHDTEAAIWDLLTIGYPYGRLVSMLSLLLSLPREDAARTLVDVLHRWQEAGLVYVVQEADGG